MTAFTAIEQTRRGLRHLPLEDLLAELTRRQRARPQTGIPTRVAETLVDMFLDDERTNAVLLVSRVAQCAITWEDRDTIQTRLGVVFTEAQWARVALQLERFDEWDNVVDDGRARAFIESCLDRAGLGLAETGDVDGPDFAVVELSR